jgi:zinc protease
VLLNPSFSAEEWDRFRTRTKATLQQQRTNPSFLASETFNRVTFGTHPAARVSTTAAMLDAMTPQTLAEFHRTRYVPDHAVIAFAGDISLAEARKIVEAKLGGWKKSGVPKPTVTDPPAIGVPVYLIARPGSVQTTLFVGTQSMTRTDADYTALTVVNRVLGGTMGRLFRHLREEKGYTYGIGSGFSATQYRGSWTATTSVRTDVTEPALTDLLAEIAELRSTPNSRERAGGRQTRDRRGLRYHSRIRSRSWATTWTTGPTGCRPITGTPIPRASAPSPPHRRRRRRRSTGIRPGCRSSR